jgi:hypothetical protein
MPGRSSGGPGNTQKVRLGRLVLLTCGTETIEPERERLPDVTTPVQLTDIELIRKIATTVQDLIASLE